MGADISARIRRYLRPCTRISPPVHADIPAYGLSMRLFHNGQPAYPPLSAHYLPPKPPKESAPTKREAFARKCPLRIRLICGNV